MCGLCLPMQGAAHHKHARVREVAIHISNYTMRREDRGSVVVGGSIEMGDLTGMLAASSFNHVTLQKAYSVDHRHITQDKAYSVMQQLKCLHGSLCVCHSSTC